MKDIRQKLIPLLKEGYCTPQIGRIARRLHEPASTIHYNVKKLEKEGVLRRYKSVLDHGLIDEGFCAFVLINLSPDEYDDPERIARELGKHEAVESVCIVTGDQEILVKVRTKDQDTYYSFVKNVISRKGVEHINSLITLKEMKSEYVRV